MSGFVMTFDLVMRYGNAFCIRPKIDDPDLLEPAYRGYHVFAGSIPDGAPVPQKPLPLLRALCDPGCTECGGNPKCGGGGPPPAEKLVRQALARSNSILIAPTVTFAGGYLRDTGNAQLWVPVLEPASPDELLKALKSLHGASPLAGTSVAYHVYSIAGMVSQSAALKPVVGKWLAIPVPCDYPAQPPSP
jgi:hypothetical protein